jgi:phage/plasmid-associated DNA primase
MDLFAAFLEERCELEADAKIKASELYQEYRAWADTNGERPLSQKWFGLRLGERGFTKTSAKGLTVWHGIRLSGRP